MNSDVADASDNIHEVQATGIVVLGMHRSGTSLAARLLGEMGCAYGGELMPAKDDNPLGFFEHAEIVDLHDAFLARLGRTWHDPRAWSDGELDGEAAGWLRERLVEVFERDFAKQPLWILKDPRMCRLLPVWQRVFEESGHRMTFLFVIRHPRAIARSLQRRNQFPDASSLLLWLRHTLESERWTRGRDRAWVGFDQLFADPHGTLRRVAETLRLADRLDFDRSKDALRAAVRSDHVHHKAPTRPEPWDWVRRLLQATEQLMAAGSGRDQDAEATCDAVAAELAAAEAHPLYAGAVELLGLLLHQEVELTSALRREAARSRGHIDKFEAHAEALTAQLKETGSYCRKLEREFAAKNEQEAQLVAYIADLEQRLGDSS